MQYINLVKNDRKSRIILGIVLIVAGAAVFFSDASFLLSALSIGFGMFLILKSLLPFTVYMRLNSQGHKNKLWIGPLVDLIIGILLLFFGIKALGIILGIIVIINWLLNFLILKKKLRVLDLVTVCLGLVLIAGGIDLFIEIMSYIVGGLLILLGILLLIHKPKIPEVKNTSFIDVDYEVH